MLSKLSHRELIKLAHRECIPPLLSSFHKGQAGGRVCVIGGCEDYTGAPYFSANAAALMGCDLTHVICEYNAATVIKSYTPNLMVHPYLRMSNSHLPNGDVIKSEMSKVKQLLERMHVIVIGPGLGRDSDMLDAVKEIIRYDLEELDGKLPIVIDADGLYLVSQDKEAQDIIKRFPKGRVILTPNVVEMKRIRDSLSSSCSDEQDIVRELNCILVEKGQTDQIFCNDKDKVLKCEQEGSNKRVGGQGDTLSGTIACMLAYSRAIHDYKIWKPKDPSTLVKEWTDYAMLSCYIGCSVTRECARLAFKARGRAMQTTDLNDRVGEVYAEMFD
ncbi:hypothetical protein RNJ44_00837 [Nakaseomyces bracarensis]|uniref:ATP-dependent (S)-NAD(P)H-hydrate dehydratase n=1 Tax=Nakaseomyces bracarensis TaxID=273131 RepID=A0ABR4NS76_9SACH